MKFLSIIFIKVSWHAFKMVNNAKFVIKTLNSTWEFLWRRNYEIESLQLYNLGYIK